MAQLPERETSSMAEWARGFARFSLVLFVIASMGHRYGMVETIAFFWVLGIVACLAIFALCLAAGGFSMLWNRGDRAGKASLGAVVLATAVLVPFAFGAINAIRYPALTDISTDTIEPPLFRVVPGMRSKGMNPVVSITPRAAETQFRAYPDVTGRRFDASMDRLLSATKAVVDRRGWSVHAPLPEEPAGDELSLELYAPTWLLRYPVDAVVRLTDEGESIFVDMRMNSRFGRHDLGDGARRIHNFMADLEDEFERQSLEIIDIPESPEDEEPVD